MSQPNTIDYYSVSEGTAGPQVLTGNRYPEVLCAVRVEVCARPRENRNDTCRLIGLSDTVGMTSG